MAKNDEGEFELVLGNRQLVSVFLIVVILLGVFFSMGYIVGRNSSPVVITETSPRPAKPIIVESASRAPDPEPVFEKPSPTRPPEPAATREPNREPVKRESPPTPTPAARPEPVTASSEEPKAGQSFLQVVATTRADADIVAESLGRKGFKTAVVPGPNPTLFRVLVGPCKDAGDLSETRTRLERVGFKPYVRRY